MAATAARSSSGRRHSAGDANACDTASTAPWRFLGGGALRPRPRRAANRGRRRVGGRIAGGKGFLELLVELLLRLCRQVARRRLSRLFHPSGSVRSSEKGAVSRLFQALEGRDPYRPEGLRKRGPTGATPQESPPNLQHRHECAILRATQAFQPFNLIFLQLENFRLNINNQCYQRAAEAARSLPFGVALGICTGPKSSRRDLSLVAVRART
jgi:hypothetical protein